MKKTGRNDPCPCGSGKKFKKCCESKMIGGRYMATKVESTSRLTGLFHSRVSEIAQPTGDSKPIRASSKGVFPSAQTPEAPLPEPAPSEMPQQEEVERKDGI